jgi:hypothetical protein
MIRYRLQCTARHEFEGWFRNAADFDKQAKRKLVACPECGSVDVAKALMAPNVVTAKSRGARKVPPVPPAPQSDAPQRVANAGPRELLKMMRKLREEVIAKSEYVGPRFAEEARKMHNEEVEHRGIYGEASPAEVKDLVEDGIDIYPLPVLPEDHN